MSIVPVKYPLDLSGSASTNRVDEEPHDLPNANIRVFVPRYGAFFTDSVSLVDAASNRVLVPGVDYYPALLYRLPTQQSGHSVHQIIVIIDRSCGSRVLFTAQQLGGEYSYNYDAIVQLVETLDLDNRPILFDMIIGKPVSWNPSPHLHDIGDVYGFEYQVAGLERIRQAIMLGSSPQTKAIYEYLRNQLIEVNNTLQAIQGAQNTPAAVIAALGYTPINKAGGVFSGPVQFNVGIGNKGFFKEGIKRITATSNATVLDLSLSSIFEVTLNASTLISFDISSVPDMTADDALSFVLIIKNDSVGGRAVAFNTNTGWADKSIPPRTTTANAQDEYYFSTYNGGVNYTGSLSNENVG